jgi:mannose/fructose/N-acetylgalactosamine-specific phosphotransferase system component IID
MAAVVVRYQGQQSGYVLAARSLREVEKREDQMFLIAGLAMLCILGASLVGVVISTWVGEHCA